MDNLKYKVRHGSIIIICDSGHTNYKFNDISWYGVKEVVCFNCINKKVYNFILKLPKLRLLRFRNKRQDLLLITYNIQFFKHKLLRMTNMLQREPCIDSTTYIIFIL